LRLVTLAPALALAFALAFAGCAQLDQALSPQRPPPAALPLGDILKLNENASVATEPLVVVAVQNATPRTGQGSWKVPSLVTLRDAATGLEIGMLLDSDAQAQHRKQLGVPLVGMRVQAQGLVHRNASGAALLKPTLRWAPLDRDGPAVSADDIATGRVPEGAFAWLPALEVQKTRHESDGDWHVELPTSADRLVVEETPPYQDALAHPDPGARVDAFGMVLYDATHGWWELHPVYCWSRDRCAPPLQALGDLGGGED